MNKFVVGVVFTFLYLWSDLTQVTSALTESEISDYGCARSCKRKVLNFYQGFLCIVAGKSYEDIFTDMSAVSTRADQSACELATETIPGLWIELPATPASIRTSWGAAICVPKRLVPNKTVFLASLEEIKEDIKDIKVGNYQQLVACLSLAEDACGSNCQVCDITAEKAHFPSKIATELDKFCLPNITGDSILAATACTQIKAATTADCPANPDALSAAEIGFRACVGSGTSKKPQNYSQLFILLLGKMFSATMFAEMNSVVTRVNKTDCEAVQTTAKSGDEKAPAGVWIEIPDAITFTYGLGICVPVTVVENKDDFLLGLGLYLDDIKDKDFGDYKTMVECLGFQQSVCIGTCKPCTGITADHFPTGTTTSFTELCLPRGVADTMCTAIKIAEPAACPVAASESTFTQTACDNGCIKKAKTLEQVGVCLIAAKSYWNVFKEISVVSTRTTLETCEAIAETTLGRWIATPTNLKVMFGLGICVPQTLIPTSASFTTAITAEYEVAIAEMDIGSYADLAKCLGLSGLDGCATQTASDGSTLICKSCDEIPSTSFPMLPARTSICLPVDEAAALCTSIKTETEDCTAATLTEDHISKKGRDLRCAKQPTSIVELYFCSLAGRSYPNVLQEISAVSSRETKVICENNRHTIKGQWIATPADLTTKWGHGICVPRRLIPSSQDFLDSLTLSEINAIKDINIGSYAVLAKCLGLSGLPECATQKVSAGTSTMCQACTGIAAANFPMNPPLTSICLPAAGAIAICAKIKTTALVDSPAVPLTSEEIGMKSCRIGCSKKMMTYVQMVVCSLADKLLPDGLNNIFATSSRTTRDTCVNVAHAVKGSWVDVPTALVAKWGSNICVPEMLLTISADLRSSLTLSDHSGMSSTDIGNYADLAKCLTLSGLAGCATQKVSAGNSLMCKACTGITANIFSKTHALTSICLPLAAATAMCDDIKATPLTDCPAVPMTLEEISAKACEMKCARKATNIDQLVFCSLAGNSYENVLTEMSTVSTRSTMVECEKSSHVLKGLWIVTPTAISASFGNNICIPQKLVVDKDAFTQVVTMYSVYVEDRLFSTYKDLVLCLGLSGGSNCAATQDSTKTACKVCSSNPAGPKLEDTFPMKTKVTSFCLPAATSDDICENIKEGGDLAQCPTLEPVAPVAPSPAEGSSEASDSPETTAVPAPTAAPVISIQFDSKVACRMGCILKVVTLNQLVFCSLGAKLMGDGLAPMIACSKHTAMAACQAATECVWIPFTAAQPVLGKEVCMPKKLVPNQPEFIKEAPKYLQALPVASPTYNAIIMCLEKSDDNPAGSCVGTTSDSQACVLCSGLPATATSPMKPPLTQVCLHQAIAKSVCDDLKATDKLVKCGEGDGSISHSGVALISCMTSLCILLMS